MLYVIIFSEKKKKKKSKPGAAVTSGSHGSLALGAAVVTAGTTREERSCHSACTRTLNTLRADNGSHLLASPAAWLVDTRKSSLSRRTLRSRQRSRSPKATTRRRRRKRRWCSRVASAGHKCQIPRPSSSILRASTPRALFPQSWRTWRHNRPRSIV